MIIIKRGNLNLQKKDKVATVYVCSKCGAEVEVDAGEAFPEKYFQFGVFEGSVKLPDEEIRNMIDKTVQKYFRSNCGYYYSGTGDTFITVFQSDENNINDYFVVVAKDYYEIDSCELEDDCLEEENKDG